MTDRRQNPFVGPRPLAYGESLYGREQELAQLRDLLISERVLLLYSPSGAGKTSLLDAGLRPALEDARFTVLPIARVGKPLPGRGDTSGLNRYLFSILTDLDEDSPSRLSLDELAGITLAEYLLRRAQGGNVDFVLMLDQFEELFTDPTDTEAKEACFAQLAAALERDKPSRDEPSRDEPSRDEPSRDEPSRDKPRKPRLWLLLAMREEYLASLDPFCQSIPGYLNVRFRLELLDAEAARQAIMRSAEDGGIPFARRAVDNLVDDLRRVLVQEADGSLTEKDGQYVEPVHLQVVCRRLWQHLPAQAKEISPEEVHTQGNVDDALAAYYDECIAGAARDTGQGERAIRSWLDDKLITAQGMRGQVVRSMGRSEGMENAVLDRLVDDHLLRAERRRGLTWYELSHDRLLEPVRESNRRWCEANLQVWQQTAIQWISAGRPAADLLAGEALSIARSWAEDHPDAVMAADREFLQASEAGQHAREAQARQKRTIRRLATVLAATVVAIGGYYSYWGWTQLRPWGLLVNLSDGHVERLRGDYAVVGGGRATPQIRSLSLSSPAISPAHLVIDRQRRVLDLGTINGTSRNGRFVGDEDAGAQELSDGDVLVLANIAPFKFRGVDYAWSRLWAGSEADVSAIPQDSWALLIDGASRAVHYLVGDSYYVGLEGDRIVASGTRTAQSRLILRRRARSLEADGVSIENLDDKHELSAAFKLGAYTYGACRIPSTGPLVQISFSRLEEAGLCERITSRAAYREAIRGEQPVENLIFYYRNDKSSFRVIPRIVGLDQQQ